MGMDLKTRKHLVDSGPDTEDTEFSTTDREVLRTSPIEEAVVVRFLVTIF